MNQTFLGFDFGTKRIGVAVGQTITQGAQPISVIKAVNGLPRWEDIAAIIKKWQPEGLVVGIPLNMDGTEQVLTDKARHFALGLQKHFPLPIYGIDERLTSRSARESVFAEKGYRALKAAKIDSLAAQLILQDWLLLSDAEKLASKL